ncbi:ATP-binding protein [Rhizobium leguminosarum]|uniref:ATP-binding protein n=1 Tax=Rhizobium leguminosarum TaxID=384 RepID=UPI001C9680A4|nr:ATP-binding protein [Rhizobium leguminosarum]MBY5826578.1 ATP-binding protein [Rhizobium leguminosarum]
MNPPNAADYRGARASNAGDQFHELWALQTILGLLIPGTQLAAVSVEGIGYEAGSTAGADAPTWDGVDCALYYGAPTLKNADRVEFAQLKYSPSAPTSPWSVARLTYNSKKTGDNSVIRRLADDFAAARADAKPEAAIKLNLVSNQPAGADILDLLSPDLTTETLATRAVREINLGKVATASGLTGEDLKAFLAALDLSECGSLSRFALRESVVEKTTQVLGDEVGNEIESLQAQVRTLMLPERAREFVDEHKLLTWFDVGDRKALFPSPQDITLPKKQIVRVATAEVLRKLDEGKRLLLVHGEGGCGKTTLTQQLASRLPSGSAVVTYDCYGAGRYMYSDDRRHLPERAFLQIINDLALAAELPILIPRSRTHPVTIEVLFKRLRFAGEAIATVSPDAIVLIIVDAADNATTAAARTVPPDPSFVHELATANLESLPPNVRFVVSARTARKDSLSLPPITEEVPCLPFTEGESRLLLLEAFPNASNADITSFHALTGGNPRVQSYALQAANGKLETLFEALLPNGKSLPDVIEASFRLALHKLGERDILDGLVASLAYLPTPATLAAVAATAGTTVEIVRDFVRDLGRGLRLEADTVTVSDEDFEDHIKARAAPKRTDILGKIADYFWTHYKSDAYSATYVADYLIEAERQQQAFDVIDTDTKVQAVQDPIRKREIQIRRLTLALASCRQTGNTVKALQTILIGAEAQHDEGAFYALIDRETELATEFSGPSIMRRTLLDRDEVGAHGSVMAHFALSAGRSGDRAASLYYLRMYDAWIGRRPQTDNPSRRGRLEEWKVEDDDIAARVEAVFLVAGAHRAMHELWRWTPRRVRLVVGLKVVPRLIAAGRGDALLTFLEEGRLNKPWPLVLAVPLAQAGFAVPSDILLESLRRLRSAFISGIGSSYSHAPPEWEPEWIRTLISACELAHARGCDGAIVARAVSKITKALENSRQGRLYTSDAIRIDGLMRLWLLARSIAGDERKAGDLVKYADGLEAKPVSGPPAKPKVVRKKSRADTPKVERDDEKERLHRVLHVLFPLYAQRIDLIDKRRSGDDTPLNVAKLSVSGNSYQLDQGYQGGYLRVVAARSVAELLFLGGMPIDQLYERSMRTASEKPNNFLSRDALILSVFRMSSSFHPQLMTHIATAAAGIRSLSTRATDKVEELVGLARLVLPINRPDAQAYFNEAVTIAKEIDEEAIDQINFSSSLVDVLTRSGPWHDPVLASKFATFAAAASIRLEGHEGFSWERVAQGLVGLHLPTAFSTAARWMDDGTASLRDTLRPLLAASISSNQIDARLALALSILLDGPDLEVITALVPQLHAMTSNEDADLLEETSRLILLAEGQGVRPERARRLLAAASPDARGEWLSQLRRFMDFAHRQWRAPKAQPKNEDHRISLRDTSTPTDEVAPIPPVVVTMLSKAGLEQAIQASRGEDRYWRPAAALGEIASTLRMADRVPFLAALTAIDSDLVDAADWSPLLANLLRDWSSSPAVQLWCRNELPAVIAQNLASFARYLRSDNSRLDGLLDYTQASANEQAEILIDGIASCGIRMGSSTLFGIASRIAATLPADGVEALLRWYLDRLVNRLPETDRQARKPVDVPDDLDHAIARFHYSLLSDIDTRVRWRAAHSIRCLARLGLASRIAAIFAEAGRTSDNAFRDPQAPFYFLGARLWLGIVAYRLSIESPTVLPAIKDVLLSDALLSDPHVAIREYIKRALLQADAANAGLLNAAERQRVSQINRPKK